MRYEDWLKNCSNEELNEIMDSSDVYIKKSVGFIGNWTFTTKNNNTYSVYCSEIEKDVYDVIFSFKVEDGGEYTGITNLNDNPTKIFNTVYTIIENEVIKKFSPAIIQFEAQGEKRVKIYDIVIKRYITKRMEKYGYKLETGFNNIGLKLYKFTKV